MTARMPLFLRGLTVLLLIAFPSLVHAATLNVPSTAYPTIQSGVNASHDGDTVLVADGTYTGDGNRDIDFNGKNITVTSKNGPTKTIIDCGGHASTDGSGNHRGFYIHSGETAATISGFTVKNGYETYVSTVTNSGFGGGICIDNTGPGTITVTNCTVSGNTASDGFGGGVYNGNVNSGTITLTNCTVSGNTASEGGGVYNDNSGSGTIMLTNCTVSGNTASSVGGVCNGNVNSGTITLTNCTVSGNTASSVGGGVYNYNGNGGTITLTNCTVSGNTASDGGGVYNGNVNVNSGTITLTNCTVSGNTASHGGGVYNYNYYGSGTITMTNVIIYGDSGGEVTNDATVTYSDVQGGYPGTANIDKDPLFVNASAGDLHLKSGSPCLGAGTPLGAPFLDLDGHPRPDPPSMGAYDSNGSVNSSAPAVLLVHGTWAGASAWDKGMAPRLKAEGFTVEAVDFPTEPETLSNETFIELQAKALARRIQGLQARSGRSQVSLVCHSMGGLAARYYLEHSSLWPIDPVLGPQSCVDKVILLSTPNWGLDGYLLDPVASIPTAHAQTLPLSPDGYDSAALDTYASWSPALREMFAEWEPAPADEGDDEFAYPTGYKLSSWPKDFLGYYVTTIQPVASYGDAEYYKTLWYATKYVPHGLQSTDYSAVADVLGEFPLSPGTSAFHLDYYTQQAQQLGVMCPATAATAGVDGRLVSPFLKELNTTPDNSGAKMFLVGAIYPVAFSFGSNQLSVLGPYSLSLPNDGIVPTESALGQDPITKIYLYPNAVRAIFDVDHTDLPNEPGVINQVVQWLKGTTFGTTHILWNNTDGTVSLWDYSPTNGNFTFHNYVPDSGWTAKAIADGGTDGKTRLLLTKSDGTAALWNVTSSTGAFTTSNFGPYSGWTANAVSVASDNTTHILWTNTNGTAALWNVVNGQYQGEHDYGSYSGWTAKAIADDPDGNTRLLWTNTNGQAAIWSVTSSTGKFSQSVFGPYAGWTAKAISASSTTTHVLWSNTNGTQSVWNYNPAIGTFTYATYGPYSGWIANALADGSDRKVHLLWDNVNGQVASWNLDYATGAFSAFSFGPFGGWTPVAISAGE